MSLAALELLKRSAEGASIGDYDIAFARLVAGIDANDAVVLAAALVAGQTREGHVCLDLAAVAGQSLFDGAITPPPLAEWRTQLQQSAAVVGAEAALADGAARPLVLDAGGRLYLHRYWCYEQSLAMALVARAAAPAVEVDAVALEAGLARWFADVAPDDAQRRAAVAAVTHRLTIIVGGPGTGKTTTVARILALLAAQPNAPRRVRLAAPTGKAAARLNAAIHDAHAAIGGRFALPQDAQTIHRLLGAKPQSTFFRHDATRQLDADCVIVDECSMLDLALAAKLVAAVPADARLILLGDPDQLASVEAGAVLASLCAGGLDAVVSRLARSYRFDGAGGIGQLARAVRAGDAESVRTVLAAPRNTDGERAIERGIERAIERIEPVRDAVLHRVQAGFVEFTDALAQGAPPASLFAALDRFRVLAAERRGPLGARAINAAMETSLRASAGVGARSPWYAGRVVIVTENDYGQRLFNGDIGIALPDPVTREVKIVFAQGLGAGGDLRWLSPARMPACETAFALTVHKSQGSEFERVLVVFPSAESPLATRELLYTAITRARSSVTLAASETAIEAAVARRQIRHSGLDDALVALLRE